MPKGSVPKREAKKPKKVDQKKVMISAPIATSEGVEVTGKRRKRKNDDDF